jgi:tetratricopeptide (TPR) repeat protein
MYNGYMKDEQQDEVGAGMKTFNIYTRIFIVFLCMITGVVSATTWAPVEKECPICHTRSTYYGIKSAGSYIYEYPSKFEYIFWPYIDNRVVYTCRKCWFSCFPWDFLDIPKDKHTAIRRILDSIALFETNGDYYVIPMSYRMEIAEQIYRLLDKDDEFWCHFYRVKAYHLAAEEKLAKAAQARTAALELAEKMLRSEEYTGMHKELHLIAGAMKYYLADYQGAADHFEKARQLVFKRSGMDRAGQVDVDEYLTALLDEYRDKIDAVEMPRIAFSETPTIADLVRSPALFVDSCITVTGLLINRGAGYFKDFRPALQDSAGYVIPVLSWAPLEVPPPMKTDIKQPRVMSYFLGNYIEARGFFRQDRDARFGGTHYLEVRAAEIVP